MDFFTLITDAIDSLPEGCINAFASLALLGLVAEFTKAFPRSGKSPSSDISGNCKAEVKEIEF